MQLLSDYKLACWLTCSMDISFDHVHDVSFDKEGGMQLLIMFLSVIHWTEVAALEEDRSTLCTCA